MSLQSDIFDGLNIPNWDESITAVKLVVANALHRVDPSTSIEDTGYFNHSFVPDFLLTWPRDADWSRDVYLRLDRAMHSCLAIFSTWAVIDLSFLD